jgi:hypothetical protein
MAFALNLEPDEVVLVDCRVTARRGMPFSLMLTDRRLVYGRWKTIAFSDPVETIAFPIVELRHVAVRKLNPIFLWSLGTVILAAFLLSWWPGLQDGNRELHRGSFTLLVGAALCFVGGRDRWQLEWYARSDHKRYRLKQPTTSNLATRAQMSSAVREVASLLQDPRAREQRVMELRLAAAPEPALALHGDDGERRLCADGACTGLVGADGRCRVCGRAG